MELSDWHLESLPGGGRLMDNDFFLWEMELATPIYDALVLEFGDPHWS